MNIAVDIDLTIVDTGASWLAWLKQHFPMEQVVPCSEVSYNLGEYFGESTTGLHHFEYWDNNHLYDELEFIHGVVENLGILKSHGHNIYFVSHTRPGHFKSKFRMLSRLEFIDFKGGDAFLATQEKGSLSGSVDVIIDDRHAFLNQFADDVIKIKFSTPYTQDEELIGTVDLATSDWTVIKDFIMDIA